MPRAPLLISLAFLMLACGGEAYSQNISGVSSAKVAAGEREIGYRAAYRLDGESADGFAQRFHYQQSLDDRWRVRVIALQSDERGDLKFRSAQIEALMQFVEGDESGGWDSAIRADGTIPLEDLRPGRARLGWLNQYNAGGGWELRADLFVAHDIGGLARNSFMLEARAEASYRVAQGLRIGVQSYNSAFTVDLGDQRRQLGLVIKRHITRRLAIEASALFGLSQDSPDADLRTFLALAL